METYDIFVPTRTLDSALTSRGQGATLLHVASILYHGSNFVDADVGCLWLAYQVCRQGDLQYNRLISLVNKEDGLHLTFKREN